MKVGSLFSGVGGFDLGLEQAGMEVVWQVEYDEQARDVLRRHWPAVDLHKDVCDVGSNELATVDLICGGFPCQDLSVAGRRAGLAGERSGLFYEFMRIVDELAPRWVLIENVPGLLSSNGGRDMGAVVGTLAELGYGWTYRVVDTQYFGPPQRRRRVFIVGRAGGFCPPEVLLEPESLPWDPPPSREAGQGAAGAASEGAGGEGRVAGTVASKWAKGTGGPAGDECYNIVAPTLEATDGRKWGSSQWVDRGKAILTPFDTTQITLKANYSRPKPGDPCHPLVAGAHPSAVAYESGPGWWNDGGHAGALRAEGENRPSRPSHVVMTAVPRRLTPRECERLQGFPDDWTRYGRKPDGEVYEQADSPRYRQLGNAVSVPVAEWIGRRIMEVA